MNIQTVIKREDESRSTMARGGTKRKIEIKKRETKEQRAVAYSKRRKTLFSKSAELCCLSGANIAVFVTSPGDKPNVASSFSGHASASEIVDCYFNGTLPPKISVPESKSGFWWTDPDLYSSCDDLSQLDVIEDLIKRTKKDLMDCLEKQEKSRVCCFDSHQNPNSSSQAVTMYQNTSKPLDGSSQVIYGGESSSGQSRYLVNKDVGNCLWETKKENNLIMSVPQEREQTQSIINVDGGDEGQSFWDELYNEDMFGLNNGEDDVMIDIGEFLNEIESGES
ncbi:hypothetical protein BRARA_B03530 [Brassica rapa]|uniref:MADS-box domain-containing protein n=1 Tax=Brassica campestris TaxID=3711 RepID=A0A398AGB1_BRACM|nr:hypothetical protein BRARA_B03530 [Brassica rapa]